MADHSKLTEFRRFMPMDDLPDLGPGPRKTVWPHELLERPLEQSLAKSGISSTARDLVRALILLWHDRLDAAHTIAQGIEDADGSFVHGIVHRREPDYGNARYWFRRVDGHGAFPRIAERVGAMLEGKSEALKRKLIPDGEWDPFAFIDLCEGAARKPGSEDMVRALREVQGIEANELLGWFVGEGK